MLLLVAMGERREGELAELYRFGDAAERRGILRALPFLEIGDRGLGLTDDAIRTNDTRLIAAALGPVRHRAPAGRVVRPGRPEVRLRRRPDHRRWTASPTRVTPDGARMLAAFVHERVAAGRDVPAEVWIVIDKYPHAEEIAAIEAELESEFDDRRAAAQRALSHRIQETA